MKLEKYIEIGRDLRFPTETRGNTVLLSPIFEEIFRRDPGSVRDKADIAHSAVRAALKGLISIATDRASELGMDGIGITGGVSYSAPILRITEEELGRAGFKMFVHDFIPNGDGGIAYGQNFITARIVGE